MTTKAKFWQDSFILVLNWARWLGSCAMGFSSMASSSRMQCFFSSIWLILSKTLLLRRDRILI